MWNQFNKTITARVFFTQFTIVLLFSGINSLHALNSLENITILPGQSKTFSKTVFNSEATSYSITVSKPSFITFTDLGAERFMSSIRLKFKLSVSLLAPGGTHEVNIRYRFNAGFPSSVSFAYDVFTGSPSPVEDQKLDIPLEFSLNQNYPNPFNPTTTIEFALPKTCDVTLKIFNILGEEVTTLVSDRLTAGGYFYEWNASNLASGVYLYRLEADDFIETKRMALMR